MNRLTLWNLSALLAALGLSVWLVAPTLSASNLSRGGVAQSERGPVSPNRYGRIVSASTVADDILLEICEPGRLVGVTTRATEHPLFGHKFAGKAPVHGLQQLEQVMVLKPDLVLVNHFAEPRHVARLREQGIVVYDLGQMLGLPTLIENIHTIGRLVGHPARARRMADNLVNRLEAVAADIPDDQRPRAAYVSVYVDQLFGGGRGTSYHDVMTYGGLKNAEAERYEGWPQLNAEKILELDPELIVTKTGMGPIICRHPGFELLRPCKSGKVVEIDPNLMDDAGPYMLNTAEAIRTAVHGKRGR